MKTLIKYLNERLVINKSYKDVHNYTCAPKTFNELRKIIEDRYKKLGPGAEQKPIDFNDIDVSNIDSFYNDKGKGIFQGTEFKFIDISDWNVSNIKSMRHMFFGCKKLESVGDISEWDVSSVTDMQYMFCGVVNFNQDISKWDVSEVRQHAYMFEKCPIKEEYKPKFK